MSLFGHSTTQALNRSTGLHVRFGFRQADDFLAVLPLTALLQNLDALEAFQHIALGSDRAGSF